MQVRIDCPYPKNLLFAVFGVEGAPNILPQDIEAAVECALSLLDNNRAAQIMLLRFRDGLTLDQIAAQFGITKECVRQTIIRTLQKLRHPSKAPYLLHGCAELERQRAERMKEKCGDFAALRSGTLAHPAGILPPLHDIPAPYDRADAVLLRSCFCTLEEIDLPFRCYNALRRSGITHVWQICFLTPKAVMQVKSIGRHICAQIREVLLPMGLDLDNGLLSNTPGLKEYAWARHRMWVSAETGSASQHFNSNETGGNGNVRLYQ